MGMAFSRVVTDLMPIPYVPKSCFFSKFKTPSASSDAPRSGGGKIKKPAPRPNQTTDRWGAATPLTPARSDGRPGKRHRQPGQAIPRHGAADIAGAGRQTVALVFNTRGISPTVEWII